MNHHWQPVGAVSPEELLARLAELREEKEKAPAWLQDSLEAEQRKLLAELQRP